MSATLINVIWKVPAPRVKMLLKTQLAYKKNPTSFLSLWFLREFESMTEILKKPPNL